MGRVGEGGIGRMGQQWWFGPSGAFSFFLSFSFSFLFFFSLFPTSIWIQILNSNLVPIYPWIILWN
jgi:hypothetical protein